MNTAYLAMLLCCLFQACAPSFKKACEAYENRNIAEATKRFEQFRQRPKYAAAAQYFLGKIKLADTRELSGLLLLDRELQTADSLWRQLSPRVARRQSRRYGVDSAAITTLREQTQRWAIVWTRVRNTLPALDSLLQGLPHPLPVLQPDLENTHRDIVNSHLETSDYDTMTAILRQHLDYVLPENYYQTRRMQEELWPAFTEKYAPCAIDRFAREHPNTFAGRDCWLEAVKPLLCTGTLEELLDFHTQNRWTALEIVLLNRIADLETVTDSITLSPAHRAHLADLHRRNALRQALYNTPGQLDTNRVAAEALHFISRYAPRYSAFRLMEECMQYFLDGKNYDSAINLLEQGRPYFPDTLPPGCFTNFDYQHRVKPWIDGKLPILRRPPQTVVRHKLSTLNTVAGDEFSPVVRTDGLEIYFAATGRPDNLAGADVYVASRNDTSDVWTTPALVPALSGFGQQIPLSITADGRQLLLYHNGGLCLSQRNSPDATWSSPEPVPVSGIPIMGKGQLSADGNTLVLEGAYSTGSALQAPDLDIFISQRDPATGAWSRPAALGADINTDGQETSPFLSPDGQILYYTSTGYPGLGSSDVFVAFRTTEDWTHWTRPKNLGKEINNTWPHRGFTTISPDGRKAWLSVDGDLWELELSPE